MDFTQNRELTKLMAASLGDQATLVALENVTLLPSDQHLYGNSDQPGSRWAYDERYSGGTIESDSDAFQLLYTTVNRVTLPTLGLLGMLGNLANIIIFARRYTKRTVNATERGAVLGFVALAASDLCFCLGLVPRYGLPSAPSVVYDSRTDFALLYQMYGLYVHDLFIKVSTWLATVISVSRYANVARSLQVPTKGGVLRLKAAIVAVYIIWPLLLLPRLWTYDVTALARHVPPAGTGGEGSNETVVGEPAVVYVLHLGAFKLSKRVKLGFTYVWVLFGYFLPVAILVYCNVCLVVVLRRNRTFWEQDSGSTCSGDKRSPLTQQWRMSRSGSMGQQQHHCVLHHHPHHPSHPPPPPPQHHHQQQYKQQTNGGRLSLARVSRRGSGGSSTTHRYWGLSVSALLVVLVSMFLVLVSPSELLHFYDDLVQPATFRAYEAAILATNVLQAVNFAVHFVLYCVFSRPYRRALYRCALALRSRVSRAHRRLAAACCPYEQQHYELQMPLTVTTTWRPCHQRYPQQVNHQLQQQQHHRSAAAAAATKTAGGSGNRPTPPTATLRL